MIQFFRPDGRALPLVALFFSGLGWGTTGLFVRVLGEKGFSSFELLMLRLIVVFIALVPAVALFKQKKSIFQKPSTHRRLMLQVGGLMLFYYLGAITAFQNLSLVLAVLVIGSSPLIAWAYPLAMDRRMPSKMELYQGVGVAIGIAGLVGLVLNENSNRVAPGSSLSLPEFTVGNSFGYLVGYLGGFVAALVTVLNARTLSAVKKEEVPSPVLISFVTASLGLLISPFLFIQSEMLWVRILDSWFLIAGFGLVATLIPGLAISYASSRLSPTSTSTVSIQLQFWTAVLGWIILNESLNSAQIFSALSVVIGTSLCVYIGRKKPPNVTGTV